jgi:hypothetical protein
MAVVQDQREIGDPVTHKPPPVRGKPPASRSSRQRAVMPAANATPRCRNTVERERRPRLTAASATIAVPTG